MSFLHHLQLERGCSCALVGSGGVLIDFQRLVTKHRTELDDVLKHEGGDGNQIPTQLIHLRAAVDATVARAGHHTPEKLAAAFWDVMSGYTELIADAIEDEEYGDALRPFPHSFKRGSGKQRAATAFINLKEAMGIERSFICGVLSLPEAGLEHLPNRAFADFVLCLEKQRAEKAAARAAAPASMLAMFNAAFELSPELSKLQDELLRDFDVIALRQRGLTVQQWWGLITNQMNRMEELQNMWMSREHGESGSDGVDEASPKLSRRTSPRSSPRGSPIASPVITRSGITRSRSLGAHPDPSSSDVDDASEVLRPLEEAARRQGLLPLPARSVETLESIPAWAIKEALLQLMRHDAATVGLQRAPAGGAGGTPAAGVAPAAGGTPAGAVTPAAGSVLASVMQREAGATLTPFSLNRDRIVFTVDTRMQATTPQSPHAGAGSSVQPWRNRVQRLSRDSTTALTEGFARLRRSHSLSSGYSSPDDEPADSNEIALEHLTFKARVGKGGFSTTYKAHWKRQGTEPSVTVAVKVASSASGSLEQLRTEMGSMMNMAHPNIVKCHGYVVSPPNHCIVLEFCRDGDLFDTLRKPTGPGFLLQVARGVASALAYLHGLRWLHRDVKSANVLMTKGTNGTTLPKLTDFGLAKELPDHSNTKTGKLTAETGSYRWMAPEVIRHDPYSTGADIFSFAMVLFELVTHRIPWCGYDPIQAAAACALSCERPPLPLDTPSALRSLITRAWTTDTAKRPSAATLKTELDSMELLLSPGELEWLDAPNGHEPPMEETLQDGWRGAANLGDFSAPKGGDKGAEGSASSRRSSSAPRMRPGASPGGSKSGSGGSPALGRPPPYPATLAAPPAHLV